MFLNCAQLRRMDERITVFFREIRRHLDLQPDAFHHACDWAAVDPLHELHTLGGKVALITEAQDKDPCAGSNGGKKHFEGAGGAGYRGLIGGNREGTKVGVYTRTTWEVDDHFH